MTIIEIQPDYGWVLFEAVLIGLHIWLEGESSARGWKCAECDDRMLS
jgi:hypothetical protein